MLRACFEREDGALLFCWLMTLYLSSCDCLLLWLSWLVISCTTDPALSGSASLITVPVDFMINDFRASISLLAFSINALLYFKDFFTEALFGFLEIVESCDGSV